MSGAREVDPASEEVSAAEGLDVEGLASDGAAPAGGSSEARPHAADSLALAPFPWWETLTIVVAAIYLSGPWRTIHSDVSVFLGGLVLLAVARARVPPRPAPQPGAPRALALVGGITVVGVVALLLYGRAIGSSSLRPALLLVTCLLYLPFAYLQQVLSQRYLTARLGRRLGGSNPLHVALWGGLIFGLAHLPFPKLILPTVVMGVFWGYAYLLSGRLLPVAFSHALLGAVYFLTVLDRDPFRELNLGV